MLTLAPSYVKTWTKPLTVPMACNAPSAVAKGAIRGLTMIRFPTAMAEAWSLANISGTLPFKRLYLSVLNMLLS